MSIGIEHNRDLSARLASLLTNASIVSVMEQQPVRWRPAAWQDRWRARKLPHPQVLDELQQEYAAHGTIRRSFVFTYHNRAAVELFIAVMAWAWDQITGVPPRPTGSWSFPMPPRQSRPS